MSRRAMSPYLEFETITRIFEGKYKYELSISVFNRYTIINKPSKILDLAWWLRDKIVPWLEKEALRLEKLNK